jgi:hypothetical protein
MKVFLQVVGLIVLVLAFAAGISLITGYFVMLLWNWLMPEIFGLMNITYWQGWGLATLCSLLFKSTNTTNNSNK